MIDQHRELWATNQNHFPSSSEQSFIFQANIFLFLFILLSVPPLSEWECFEMHRSQAARADLFSQDLQICFTWNILYFEHHPGSIHTFSCLSLFSLFSTHLPPQIRVVNAFRQAQQQQGSGNTNLQVNIWGLDNVSNANVKYDQSCIYGFYLEQDMSRRRSTFVWYGVC